jgi:phosphinothricin acetyltransferase
MTANGTTIRRLTGTEAEVALPALAAILIDAVASGASVNFLAGCDEAQATSFWRGQLPGIADGSRILLVAETGATIVGTVVITLAHQQNSPFRAEVGKMLVHSFERGRGIGRQLLAAAEQTALDAGRTLLMLDTEAGSAGERLYRACGWTVLGTVPDFCLANDGSLVASVYFYKHLAPAKAQLDPAKPLAPRPEAARSVLGRAAVRPARPGDLPTILAIYNEAVETTTAIWNWTKVDLANRRAWFDARAGQGYPVLVAEGDEGRVLAYASFGDWRPFDGYLHTVEHSVYVAADARGRGLGAVLLASLVEEARRLGKHVILGGIEAGNTASLALHRKLGFVETARMPGVGRKFDRWLDLVFMQKML